MPVVRIDRRRSDPDQHLIVGGHRRGGFLDVQDVRRAIGPVDDGFHEAAIVISGLLRREGHRGRHDRSTRAKEVDQYVAHIEATKTCRVDHAGENLCGPRAHAAAGVDALWRDGSRPMVFAAAPLALIAVALVACALPAWARDES